MNIVRVGMAEMGVGKNPTILVTVGLGSCVALMLYDPVVRLGGMAHIMLPYHRRRREQEVNPAKYADTALPHLIEKMTALGAIQRRLQAKLAGGAQMFQSKGSPSEILQVGKRNIEASERVLADFGIEITSRDTGGNFGRTLEFSTVTGLVHIKTITHGIKII